MTRSPRWAYVIVFSLFDLLCFYGGLIMLAGLAETRPRSLSTAMGAYYPAMFAIPAAFLLFGWVVINAMWLRWCKRHDSHPPTTRLSMRSITPLRFAWSLLFLGSTLPLAVMFLFKTIYRL